MQQQLKLFSEASSLTRFGIESSRYQTLRTKLQQPNTQTQHPFLRANAGRREGRNNKNNNNKKQIQLIGGGKKKIKIAPLKIDPSRNRIKVKSVITHFSDLPVRPFVYLFCCLFVPTLFFIYLVNGEVVSFAGFVPSSCRAIFSFFSLFFPFSDIPDNIKTWPEEFAELIQHPVENWKENQSSKEKTTVSYLFAMWYPLEFQYAEPWNNRVPASYLQTCNFRSIESYLTESIKSIRHQCTRGNNSVQHVVQDRDKWLTLQQAWMQKCWKATHTHTHTHTEQTMQKKRGTNFTELGARLLISLGRQNLIYF